MFGNPISGAKIVASYFREVFDSTGVSDILNPTSRYAALMLGFAVYDTAHVGLIIKDYYKKDTVRVLVDRIMSPAPGFPLFLNVSWTLKNSDEKYVLNGVYESVLTFNDSLARYLEHMICYNYDGVEENELEYIAETDPEGRFSFDPLEQIYDYVGDYNVGGITGKVRFADYVRLWAVKDGYENAYIDSLDLLGENEEIKIILKEEDDIINEMGKEMSSVKLFESKKIRSVWNEEEEKWYFSIVDVIEVLTDSPRPRKYWNALKTKLFEEGSELSQNMGQLKMQADDGKMRMTDVADTEQLFRLIQSIPSPKAEPFKRWLAKVGYERIQEIEDPELAAKRMKEIYRAKGYSEEWIEKRMRGIAVRDELTGEWDKRGVEGEKEYSILTAEISQATFGMTPAKYREYKGLDKENLRDHMTDLELIFTMLGEASTTELARVKDAQGFIENKTAAKLGGEVAGSARKDLEYKTGKKITTDENYIEMPEKVKRLKGKK